MALTQYWSWLAWSKFFGYIVENKGKFPCVEEPIKYLVWTPTSLFPTISHVGWYFWTHLETLLGSSWWGSFSSSTYSACSPCSCSSSYWGW